MKNLFLLSLLSAFLFVACNDDDVDIITPPNPTTITDVAVGDNDLSILVTALQRTGLDAALDNESGDFTVFAPTNSAFQQLLTDLGLSSLDDVSDADLTKILQNHVIGQSITASQLATGYESVLATEATTSNPLSLYVDVSNLILNGQSTIQTSDIAADNGVVHKVNRVITLPTVVTFATTNPEFSILVEALTRASFGTTYTDLLSGTTNSPFTVFAPTNQAFVDLLEELDVDNLSDVDDETLQAVLNYHVVANGNVLSSTLTDGQTVPTFGGSSFTIDLDNGAQIVDASGRVSDIVITDVQANNGVIHAINKVLLPMTESSTTSYAVTSSGASAYIFNGGGFSDEQNPNITLTRGMTYEFAISANNHPFYIKTAQTTGQGDQYTNGVTNNGTGNGTITFTVPMDAPDMLFYQCEFHSPMTGQLNIVD